MATAATADFARLIKPSPVIRRNVRSKLMFSRNVNGLLKTPATIAHEPELFLKI
ncbi:hypothetical protein [Marinobacter sp. 1-3A]|uniref:hypothetical protein n=1 Tax=Marinobacter sp. 1-3A TaxID=2582920 RepID=UPI0019063A37|nr:hypothetical protein [Marinobacter sp. 1-3A]